jgi:hypothetical protein
MRSIALLVLWMAAAASSAEEAPASRMTQQRLHEIIAETGRNMRVEGNVVAFQFGDVALLCISDPDADRMRIITPVKRVEEATSEEILAAMSANFHSALDARYAISQGVIFVAFLHPLSPLTAEQVVSAIRQVASARATFGDSYSGGTLFFR